MNADPDPDPQPCCKQLEPNPEFLPNSDPVPGLAINLLKKNKKII